MLVITSTVIARSIATLQSGGIMFEFLLLDCHTSFAMTAEFGMITTFFHLLYSLHFDSWIVIVEDLLACPSLLCEILCAFAAEAYTMPLEIYAFFLIVT